DHGQTTRAGRATGMAREGRRLCRGAGRAPRADRGGTGPRADRRALLRPVCDVRREDASGRRGSV
ncbi:MAG: hypothetical protein AVDCRST_MAG85-3280, partial [uncultured Solirubrobacteraceae bacterium]